MLSKFERYKLTFGPPRSRSCSANRPSWRAMSKFMQARRLQLRTGFRRQQAAQAGIHRARRNREQLGHPGLDRLCAIQPYADCRGRGRENRDEVPTDPGKLVAIRRRVYDRVGNILLSRIMGAERNWSTRGFDIGIRESWIRGVEDVKAKGGKPYAIPAGASVHKIWRPRYVGFCRGGAGAGAGDGDFGSTT